MAMLKTTVSPTRRATTISGENPYPRAGVSPAALSRAGFAILCGPQGHLYAVEWLGTNPCGPDTADLAYLEASRPSILFALGVQCLRSALATIQARAIVFLRARLRLQETANRHRPS